MAARSMGRATEETRVLFRALYEAPGRRMLREDVVQKLMYAVHPARAFQSRMDYYRKRDPRFPEPTQGSQAWNEVLDEGRHDIAEELLKNQLRQRRNGRGVQTPQQIKEVTKPDGVWIVLTPEGLVRARHLAAIPASVEERIRQEAAEKHKPPVDLGELLPPLSGDEYAALRHSIETFGVLQPIIIDDGGEIIDGRNRMQIWLDLGRPSDEIPFRKLAWDVKGLDKVTMTVGLNSARRSLTGEARREIMVRLRRDGMSLADIGRVFGITHSTVSDQLKVHENTTGEKVRPEKPVETKQGTHRPAATDEEIIDLKNAGYSQRAIVEALGVPRRTVRDILDRAESGRVCRPPTNPPTDTDEADADEADAEPEDEPVPTPPTKKARRRLQVVPPESESDESEVSESEDSTEPATRVCPTCGQPWPEDE
jgi:transposase